MKRFFASVLVLVLLASIGLRSQQQTAPQTFQLATAAGSAANPCLNPFATLKQATTTTSGTAAVQILALSSGQTIYVCSLTVIGVSGTTPTFSLTTGTGSACASSNAVLVPAFATAAGAIFAFANPVTVTPSGFELCYLDGGTTPVQVFALTYVQQ